MKFSKDIGFAKIVRNKPIDKRTETIFQNAFSVNKKLFKRNPKKFKIIICDTETDMKKQAKYYYHKWLTATVLRDCNLVTRSQEFVVKIGKWKLADYPKLMTHELNHAFWQALYGITKPVWLAEGIACHVGDNFILTKKELKQLIRKHKIDHSFLDYRYLKRNFEAGHVPRYPLWANFTRYIASRYSANKLVKLMDSYSISPTRKRYNKIFKQIFGKTEKELFNEFVNKYK